MIDQKRIFINLHAKGILPQVLLLHGAESEPLLKVAKQVASLSHCQSQNACESCLSCLKIQKDQHRDILLIDTKDQLIKLADVAPIKDHLSLLPAKSSKQATDQSVVKRVVIIKNADLLGEQALNQLLKSFEEPGPFEQIILTSPRYKKIPSTLLSRCVKWRIDEQKKTSDKIQNSNESSYQACLRKLLTENSSEQIFIEAQNLAKNLRLSGPELIWQLERSVNTLYKEMITKKQNLSFNNVQTMQKRRLLLHRLNQALCQRNIPLNIQLTGEAIGFMLES